MSRQKVEAQSISQPKKTGESSYNKVAQVLENGSPPIKIIRDEPPVEKIDEPDVTLFHRPEEYEKALAMHEAIKKMPAPDDSESGHVKPAQSPVLPGSPSTTSEEDDELPFKMDL